MAEPYERLRGRSRRRSLMLGPALAAVCALIVASPLLMAWVARIRLPWRDLGDIGQAYGAVSAVVSGLAICGVAASLIMQQRQNRTTELHTVRQRHFDLVRLTL